MGLSVKNRVSARFFPWLKAIALFLVSMIGLAWLAEKDIFCENMITYAPAEIHNYDNTLYSQDIDVLTQSATKSPRIGSIFIVSSLMNLGLSYESVYLLIHYITCCVIAFGGVLFVYLSGLSNKLLGILLYTITLGISRIHYFAGYFVFTLNSIFIGLGSAFGIAAVILMIYKPDIKRINFAYLFVAVAAICHIHEGIWAFCLVSFIYIVSSQKLPYNIFLFYLSVAIIMALTIPSILYNSYHLSTPDFFDIYVNGRIPHHLLVSNLEGWRGVIYMATIYASLIWLNREVLKPDEITLYNRLFILFFVTIFLWYVSSELLHVPALVKLYIAKFVKYLSIPFSLLFVQYIYHLFVDKKLLALAIVLCLFADRELWLLVMIFIHLVFYMPTRNDKCKYIVQTIMYTMCVMLFVKESHLASLSLKIILSISAFAIAVLPEKKNKWTEIVISLLFIGCFAAHFFRKTSIKNCVEFYMSKQVGKEICLYSNSVLQEVPKDALILCNATSLSNGYIQHISRRSMYALYKTVPSSDLGIKIWHDRIVETKDFCQWTPEQTAKFMREKELKYVTINVEEMANLYGDCSLFAKVAEQGSYILYKLQ